MPVWENHVWDHNGVALDYYDTDGDQPALVLLHGFLGTWNAEFGPEIEWLRSHFRVWPVLSEGTGLQDPNLTFLATFITKMPKM